MRRPHGDLCRNSEKRADVAERLGAAQVNAVKRLALRF
jgi:hypothetical protein